MAEVRALFLEYADWLQVDLCFQGFEAELATLPGNYAPPRGGLWFARVGLPAGTQIAGVVGLRPLEESGACELKRLWIRAPFRGLGLGRRLTETALSAARAAGYGCIRLDTLPKMVGAHALYRDLGFHEIAAYTYNPEPGVIYFERALEAASSRAGQETDTSPG